MRMLAKDPAERPESAQDVFNALDTIDLTARGETVERESNSLESLTMYSQAVACPTIIRPIRMTCGPLGFCPYNTPLDSLQGA